MGVLQQPACAQSLQLDAETERKAIDEVKVADDRCGVVDGHVAQFRRAERRDRAAPDLLRLTCERNCVLDEGDQAW